MTRKLIIILAAGITLSSAMPTVAQDKATGIVAVRQATMKANGDHMSAIKAILTEQPQLVHQVTWQAQAVAQAMAAVPVLFPAGSDQAPTAALPAVWSDQNGFAAAATKTEGLASDLAKAAATGDAQATLAAFATLGKEGCGGCHKTFRKPQN